MAPDRHVSLSMHAPSLSPMMDSLDALAFAVVFRDLKILIRADFFDADEHAAFVRH